MVFFVKNISTLIIIRPQQINEGEATIHEIKKTLLKWLRK